jgi:hypothetical protein
MNPLLHKNRILLLFLVYFLLFETIAFEFVFIFHFFSLFIKPCIKTVHGNGVIVLTPPQTSMGVFNILQV